MTGYTPSHKVRNVMETFFPNTIFRFFNLVTFDHLQVHFHVVISDKTNRSILKVFLIGTRCCSAKELHRGKPSKTNMSK